MNRTKYLVLVAILGTLAGIMMLLEFPLIFLAPEFYKLDLSEVVVMIGAFSLGPVAGIVIELIKVIILYFARGTMTAGVGELASFLIGVSFILPASIIYHLHKTKKTAIIGLLVGSAVMVISASILNVYVLLPAYGYAFGMTMEQFVAFGTAINTNVNSLKTFILLCVVPFNIIKVTLVSAVVILIYKRVSTLLKAKDAYDEK